MFRAVGAFGCTAAHITLSCGGDFSASGLPEWVTALPRGQCDHLRPALLDAVKRVGERCNAAETSGR